MLVEHELMQRETDDGRRVVIVGGGASGVLAAVRFLMAPEPPSEVVLVERGEGLGRGVAYSTPNRRHVLNVPAGRMSALPEDPDHFVRWLAAREGGARVHAQTYAARSDYGRYLGELLDEAERSAKGVILRRVADAAVKVELDGPRARVTLAGGETIDASRVVLALGNPPTRWPFGDELPGGQVVVDPWAPGALESIPDEGDVLVIGTGLTMIDVVLALSSRRTGGTIHAISRRGLLPHMHPATRKAWTFAVDGGRAGPIPLRALVRRVRNESTRASAEGATWHDVMDTLRPIGAALWQRLSIDDRRRFLRHVRPYWDIHRHRMAPSVAERFERLRAEGRVEIHAGRIARFSSLDGGAIEVSFAPRGEGAVTRLRVAAVINATGPASDWRASESPLIGSLVEQGLVRFDALRLGLDAEPDGRLIGADGTLRPQFVAIGPPLRGVLWETTAVPDIREQARRLAAG